MRYLQIFVSGFALVALASMTNTACSSPTSVDSGTSENGLTANHGYTEYGGYSYVGEGNDAGTVSTAYAYALGANCTTDTSYRR